MITPILPMLKAHASKEEIKYHLTGVYFDADKPLAIATDGHRMLQASTEHPELATLAEMHKGKIYSFNDHVVLDAKYPNWQSITPDYSGYKSFDYSFPDWFKGIKVGRKMSGPIFLTPLGFQLYRPAKVLAANGDEEVTPFYMGVQIAYLAPYAGIDCKIYYDTAVKPIVIKPVDAIYEWTAVVMPMRV